MHDEISSAKPPRIFWLLSGLAVVLIADGATALVLYTMYHDLEPWASNNLLIFYLAAPVATLLVSIPAWFYFIGLPRCATIKRGLLVGIVSSIIAHPIMWMFYLLFTLLILQPADWLLSLLMFPQQIFLSLILSGFSLIFCGWITTPLGALTGVLLIYLQRTLTRSAARRPRSEGDPVA